MKKLILLVLLLVCVSVPLDDASAFDRDMIPVEGEIIDSAQGQHTLWLLVDGTEGRRLHQVQTAADGYQVRTTKALPGGIRLDDVQTSDDYVELWWRDDAGRKGVCFVQRPDGSWNVAWLMSGSMTASMAYCGYYADRCASCSAGICFGSLPSLFDVDLGSLPFDLSGLEAALDKSGWAVAGEELTLWQEPGEGSLGRLYPGVPMQVLAEDGPWQQVSIGLDGLTGWVEKDKLLTGAAMDTAPCGYPHLWLKEKWHDQPMFAGPDRMEEKQIGVEPWIIGETELGLYILLTSEGRTAYAPMEWFEGIE